ncbi:MAG TPA: hypothetical protein VJJ28_00885 [Candidatus Paceibacterota bacterium]
MIEITTGVVFLLSSMYGHNDSTAVAIGSQADMSFLTQKTSEIVLHDREAVEKYLREQYADTPILVKIARCESTFSQFDKNGEVVRGKVNRADVGVMQINEKYHAEKAEELGYDIHTIEGNVSYAKYLYERQGSAPWNASSRCWRKA